jgi:hypothetical protein
MVAAFPACTGSKQGEKKRFSSNLKRIDNIWASTYVVAELPTLRGLGDTRDGGDVDDGAGLGVVSEGLGLCEQGEESERGEVVGGWWKARARAKNRWAMQGGRESEPPAARLTGVDLVSLQPVQT